MIWSSRLMSVSFNPIGRHSWCMLQPAQLAFNMRTFKEGDSA
jgi:hypothetical protein